MKTTEEIRGLSAEALKTEIKKAQKALLEVRIKINATKEKDTSKKSKQRKYIAQLKTILNEKK